MEGDTSVMTYKGHKVLRCQIRCRFSPTHTTGQVEFPEGDSMYILLTVICFISNIFTVDVLLAV